MNTLKDIAMEVLEVVEVLKSKKINPESEAVLRAIVTLYVEMQQINVELAKWKEEHPTDGGFYF